MARRFVRVALALACVAVGPVAALNTAKPLSDLTHQSWSVDEGLPHSTIRSVAQTPDGYMWFGTHEGAARFDGLNFSVFDQNNATALRGSGVASMLVQKNGNLLLGLRDGGLARYAREKFEAASPTGGMPAGTVTLLAEDAEGGVWANVGATGLVRIANNDVRVFTLSDGLPSGIVTSVATQADGTIWIGTASGLTVFKAGKFTRNPTGTGLDGANIVAIAQDREKRLWIATSGQGIAMFDVAVAGATASTVNLRRYGRDQGLTSDTLTQLLIDRDGGVWVGSLEGVFRLTGNAFERFATPDGFTNNNVREIFEDSEGSIWIGTDAGISRFRDARITTWGVRKGLSEEFARAVLEDRKQRIWVATSDGLFVVTTQGVRRYGRKEGLISGAVLSLAEDPDGALWIGTYGGGVHRLAGEKIEVMSGKFGIGIVPVRAILAARDGTLWLGTSAGILKASWLRDPHAAPVRVIAGLPSEQINSLLEDKNGRIWAGTRGGLAVIESGSTLATKVAGIDATVLGVNLDKDGRIWVSTGNGIAFVTPGASITQHTVRRLLPAEGAPAQAYFSAVDDQAGYLWTCGNRGIIRFSTAQLAELVAGVRAKLDTTQYGRAEGMATVQCNGASQPAGWRARDGRLLFPTARGVAVVDPAGEEKADWRAPPVRIKELFIDGERAKPAESGGYEVPPGKHRVEISYIGLSLSDPKKIRYRYRLEGFDPDWVEAGRETKAVYTNIHPGKYQFRALAAREGGVWSEPGASLMIEQQPRFHETAVFRVIALAATLMLMFIAYRVRVAQLRVRQQTLQRMVDERTADLEREKRKLESTNNEKAQLLVQVADAAKAYERLSNEDSLTGLANRRELDRVLAREFDRAVRTGRQLSVALADLDYFKNINDRYSHAVGDQVLRKVARILQAGCRSIDIVGRYGGEEFVLVFPEAGLDTARQICERLRLAIEGHDWQGIKSGISLTMSFGLVEFSGETNAEELLARADKRLYEAKEGGRNRIGG